METPLRRSARNRGKKVRVLEHYLSLLPHHSASVLGRVFVCFPPNTKYVAGVWLLLWSYCVYAHDQYIDELVCAFTACDSHALYLHVAFNTPTLRIHPQHNTPAGVSTPGSPPGFLNNSGIMSPGMVGLTDVQRSRPWLSLQHVSQNTQSGRGFLPSYSLSEGMAKTPRRTAKALLGLDYQQWSTVGVHATADMCVDCAVPVSIPAFSLCLCPCLRLAPTRLAM